MIYIQLNGGLGNQMFQYACGRSLSLKNATKLYLDVKMLNNNKVNTTDTIRSFELGIFNIRKTETRINNFKKTSFLFFKILNSLTIKFGLNRIQTSKYFVEREFSYNEGINSIGKESFISGNWQSPLYFQSYESIIREDFKFPMLSSLNNIMLLKKIKNTNSVSIHIRRGDYLNSQTHKTHGICSMEYYSRATSYISETQSDPVFFIFSDDIKWVKANLSLEFETYYVSENKDENSYIDMQLMSECKHNIIANSSFSWWGAWLNSNPSKIVISPKHWFKNNEMNEKTKDLIPKTWIKF